MSELILRGDGDYASIPLSDIGSPPDYTQVQLVAIDVEFGTMAEPVRIWQSGQAYLDAYSYTDTQGTTHYNLKWDVLPGWIPTGVPPFLNDIGNISTLYIGCCKIGDDGYVAWTPNDFPYPYGVLFDGGYANLSNSLSSITDWDEEPSADEDNPDNMNAIGGEFADRGFFDQTDNISLDDLPEHLPEMDYGGLIMPYILQETSQIFNLTQLNDALFLASFWQNLKNKFEGLSDPLSMVLDTIEIPYTPSGIGGRAMKLGGNQLEDSNGNPITAQVLGLRYQKFTVGAINLKEVWGTEKDYSQCSIQIYLPYVGVRDIDTDLAVNNVLTLVAYVDRWNGDILYLLHCSNTASRYKYFSSEFIAYRWNGNCAKKVPLGRVDTTNAILSLLSVAQKTAVGYASGGIVGAIGMGGAEALSSNFNPTVQSSGNVAGSVGRMDMNEAYLIIKRGVPSYPNNWRNEFGATRYQELLVQDITGYTEFAEIHADDITGATDDEKAEIENLMKSGVFIN